MVASLVKLHGVSQLQRSANARNCRFHSAVLGLLCADCMFWPTSLGFFWSSQICSARFN